MACTSPNVNVGNRTLTGTQTAEKRKLLKHLGHENPAVIIKHYSVKLGRHLEEAR
jgi:hypothetical protein